MAQDNLESLAFDLTADTQGDRAMILRSRTANAVPDPRQRGIRKKSGEQTEPCFKRLGNRACLSAPRLKYRSVWSVYRKVQQFSPDHVDALCGRGISCLSPWYFKD